MLLRDITSGKVPQVIAVLDIIKNAQPDVIALQGFDYDLTNLALRLFADQAGYPHIFAARPNTGMATGLDLNGDGRLGGPNDAKDMVGFQAIAVWLLCRSSQSMQIRFKISQPYSDATFRIHPYQSSTANLSSQPKCWVPNVCPTRAIGSCQ